jgi:hypothetical protein
MVLNMIEKFTGNRINEHQEKSGDKTIAVKKEGQKTNLHYFIAAGYNLQEYDKRKISTLVV